MLIRIFFIFRLAKRAIRYSLLLKTCSDNLFQGAIALKTKTSLHLHKNKAAAAIPTRTR